MGLLRYLLYTLLSLFLLGLSFIILLGVSLAGQPLVGFIIALVLIIIASYFYRVREREV